MSDLRHVSSTIHNHKVWLTRVQNSGICVGCSCTILRATTFLLELPFEVCNPSALQHWQNCAESAPQRKVWQLDCSVLPVISQGWRAKMRRQRLLPQWAGEPKERNQWKNLSALDLLNPTLFPCLYLYRWKLILLDKTDQGNIRALSCLGPCSKTVQVALQGAVQNMFSKFHWESMLAIFCRKPV